MSKITSSRRIIRKLEDDGWEFMKAEGSHHHFKHKTKSGKVSVPHPLKDVHPKTFKSILKQAGLLNPQEEENKDDKKA